MTIEDAEKYVAGIWDWGVLDGCWGETKIKPTDIDGLVERNGKFLLLETKADGTIVKQGQQLTFDALVQTGIFTVFLIWGNPGQPHKIQVSNRLMKKPEIYESPSLDTLRNLVSRWFIWVDGIGVNTKSGLN